MGSRGKKSKMDRKVRAVRESEAAERPCPPDTLSDEQRLQWLEIVNELPSVSLSAHHLPLLEGYIQYATQLRKIGQWLAKCGESDQTTIDDYSRLLNMQEKVTRTLASLSVGLGFGKTHESTLCGGAATSHVKPWE